MKSIYLKEIRSFLSSLIAFIVITVFLLVTGLFIWIFPDYNIFDNKYASLNVFFEMAPWVFIFLISAITMRSFSEEKKTGTLELLSTQPVSDFNIILAKYLAAITLVIFSLLPTILYYITIFQLASPTGNIDQGSIVGSYIGLFLLSSVFVSFGLFASSLTDNQIVGFILSMFLCFIFYQSFSLIADFNLLGSFDVYIEWIGIESHYRSLSRGVIDTRDILYFASLIIVMLYLTRTIYNARQWN